MKTRNAISALFGTLLVTLLTPITVCADESPPKQVWGERIWTKKIDDHSRIVVDKRGYDVKDSRGNKALGRPEYVWRLLKDGAEDGTVLYSRSADFSGSTGVKPEDKPVTVLFTDLVDGKLLTVYNQNWTIRGGTEKCWAYVVETRADGTVIKRPAGIDGPPPSTTRPTGATPSDASAAGPKLKSASLQIKKSGSVELSGTDEHENKFDYVLDSWKTPRGRISYYWKAVEKPGK